MKSVNIETANIAVPETVEITESQMQQYRKFVAYCEKKNISTNEDSLQDWDLRFNKGRIRESFGSQKDVYMAGLRHLYRRFITAYSAARITIGKDTISITTVRRVADGSLKSLDSTHMTEEDFSFIHAKAERELKAQVIRVKFLGLSPERIRAAVEQALLEEITQ